MPLWNSAVKLLCSAVLVSALTVSASAQSTEDAARRRDAAWAIVDEAWVAINNRGYSGVLYRGVYKEDILTSLARVESARATEIFRQALKTSPTAAATVSGMLAERRVVELFPEISAVLKTNRMEGIQGLLLACLEHVTTPEAVNVIRPFALEDKKSATVVAFATLNRMGPVAIPVLFEALTQGCWVCREYAASVLLHMGATTNSAVRQALGDANPRVRARAAQIMVRDGDKSAVAVLREAARGSDNGIRVETALWLYSLGETQFLETLLKESVGAPANRYFIVRRMSEHERDRRAPLRERALTLALSDPSPDVRGVVLEVDIGEESGARIVRALLRDPDGGIRLAAAKKLLTRSSDRAAAEEVLLNHFRSGPPEHWGDILLALEKSGPLGSAGTQIVNEALEAKRVFVKTIAIRAAVQMGQEAIPRLRPMLEDADHNIVAAVADALVRISPAEAAPILSEKLKSPTPHVRVICAGNLLHALELLE